MCFERKELHSEEMDQYNYIRELTEEHEDLNDVMDLPEGQTCGRIEYPNGAAFVQDPAPDNYEETCHACGCELEGDELDMCHNCAYDQEICDKCDYTLGDCECES